MINILKKAVVGIEIHDHVAQFVELGTGNGNPDLLSYNRMVIPSGIIEGGVIKKEAELQKILVELFEQANPKTVKVKNAALVLPSRVTFVHIFKFPDTLKKKDIKKAIPLQAETIIPFPIEDVYWDFTVLSKEEGNGEKGQQYVIFAAVPKGIADQYVKVLESLKITPNIFGIHAESIPLALSKQIRNKKTTLAIELGELSANYLLLKDGELKQFFSSNEGSSALITDLAAEFKVKPEEIFEQWQENKLERQYLPGIRKFIEGSYNHAKKLILEKKAEGLVKSIDDVFLTGEFSNLPNFYEIAKKKFTKQKVSIGDPKLGLTIDDAKFMATHEQKGGSIPYSIYFSNAIGIAKKALDNTGEKVNLLPDRLKKKFFDEKIDFILAATAVCLSIFSLILSGYLLFKYEDLSFDRINLEMEKASIENTLYGTRYQDIQKELTAFNAEVAILSSIDISLTSVPVVLENIDDLIPVGALINSIQFYDSELMLKISGIAESREQLLEIQDNFEAAEFISEVDIPLSNFDESSEISFQATLILYFPELPKYGESN
jgi:type IV pilus assembly protein PilM